MEVELLPITPRDVPDFLDLSDDTLIVDETAENPPILPYNPDDINIDLYEDMYEEEEEEIEEPKEPMHSPKELFFEEPVKIKSAFTVNQKEDEFIERIINDKDCLCSLYELHTMYKHLDQNEKITTKQRLLGRLRGKIAESKEIHIKYLLDNFFSK